MMDRLIHKFDDLLGALMNKNKRWKEEPDAELLLRLNEMKQQLESRKNNVFWRSIGRLDRSVMSLVLQMAPGYRDAFQIYLTVSKGLMLQGKLYQMSVKDVATLYEYWTFLKLGQILNSKYTLLSQDIVSVNRDGLFVNLEANRTAKRVFEHPVTKEKIELIYQKYEKDLPTIPQKPDSMLTIEKKVRITAIIMYLMPNTELIMHNLKAIINPVIKRRDRWKTILIRCTAIGIHSLP